MVRNGLHLAIFPGGDPPHLARRTLLVIALIAAILLPAAVATACCTNNNWIDDFNYPQIPTKVPPAPKSNDTCFVKQVATAQVLDCHYQEDGPLLIQVPVTRVIGDRDLLKSKDLLKKTAVLKIMGWDVDGNERDIVTFNDSLVTPAMLRQSSNDCFAIWDVTTFEIPIEWITFPEYDPDATSYPGDELQDVEIAIDVGLDQERYCTSVAWVSISIEVARPVIFAHGVLANGQDTWSPVWFGKLDEIGLPYIAPNMGPVSDLFISPSEFNAGLIAQYVDERKEVWGVDKVNMVCHSKGGIDARVASELTGESIEKVVMFGTPNGGTPAADSLVAYVLKDFPALGRLISPGGMQLRTKQMAEFNTSHHGGPQTELVASGTECSTALLPDHFTQDNQTTFQTWAFVVLRSTSATHRMMALCLIGR